MTGKKLSKNTLHTAEAVLGLGLVVVKELCENGIATIFINSDGDIELCPFGEHPLDSLSEGEALDILLGANYSDEQLTAYLKGRSARIHHGKNM